MIDYSDEKVPGSQSIWHYRQFAEFVSILQTQHLWFSRLNHLRDPFEGVSGRTSRFHEKADDHARKGCVSCWTIDEEESELMWYAYAPGLGVAIRSTKNKLKSSFKSHDADRIVIGAVNYDFDGSQGSPDSYAFIKQRHFKREQELRALYPYEYFEDGKGVPYTDAGRAVSVDLNSLLIEVWVAPTSSEWFRRTVEVELQQYGFASVPVRRRE